MSGSNFIPYCGSPPVPGSLTWNTDPVLIAVFLGAGAIYFIGSRTSGELHWRQRASFGSGLLITALALLSPLCSLSVALFSARVGQHMILTLIAAPLIVLGRADAAFAVFLRRKHRTEPHAITHWRSTTVGAVLYAISLWIWHWPGPYDATLQSNVVYWTMHLTTFGAALVLWKGLLHCGPERVGVGMIVGFATAMQMTLLGAVLTLSHTSLFIVHQNTTWPWGLSAIEDQQLGGLIMWIPAGLLFTAYALLAFGLWLNQLEAASAVRQSSRTGQ